MERLFDYTIAAEPDAGPPAGQEVRRLSELVAAYQQFVGHELANQLVALQAFARLLGQDADRSDEEALLLRRIADLTQRADKNARQLAEVGRLLREPAWGPPLVLADLVDEAVAEAKARHAREGAAVLWRVEASRAHVELSRDLLHAALVHLLKNAVWALQPSAGPAEVFVSAAAAEDGCLIRIRDNGSGLAEEQAMLLTEPFAASRMLPGSSPAAPGGLGLGFFFVRQAVARWGGRLSFESVIGEGTTVTLRLPIRDRDRDRWSDPARARSQP